MKQFTLSVALASVILCGANAAMATGGHETGGGGGSATEKDGSPGPDRDTSGAAASSEEAARAECARLLAERQIAQSGPTSGKIADMAEEPLDCELHNVETR